MRFPVRVLGCLSLLLYASLVFSQQPTATAYAVPFISTVAGIAPGSSGAVCSSSIPTLSGATLGDGCAATQASLNAPQSSWTDSYGNIYIADYGDYLLRVIYVRGSALASLIVAENPQVAGLVPQAGHIYTIGGGLNVTLTAGSKYYCGNNQNDGVALDSTGNGCLASQTNIKPMGGAVDAEGNIYFRDYATYNRVRIIYVGGTQVAALLKKLGAGVAQPGFVYRIAGGTSGYSGDGGLATSGAINLAQSTTVDPNGNIYIADTANNVVRRVDAVTGIISTFAGGPGCIQGTKASCTAGFSGDNGPATSAELSSPYEVLADTNGNVYIADSGNDRVRMVYVAGSIPWITNPVVGDIYTIAGGGGQVSSGSLAASVAFSSVHGIGLDVGQNLYVLDSAASRVWQVNAATQQAYIISGGGTITAISAACNGYGTGPLTVDSIGDGCPGTQATIKTVAGKVDVDPGGVLYFADTANNTIRALNYQNIFSSTAVGSLQLRTLALSFLASSNSPHAAFGGSSSSFSDALTGTCSGQTTIVAGALCTFNISFTPSTAQASLGSLRVQNAASQTVEQFNLSGTGLAPMLGISPGVTTAIGSGLAVRGIAVSPAGTVYIADNISGQVEAWSAGATSGTVILSGLTHPSQVALDGDGDVYVADTGNNRVEKYVASTGATVSLGSGLNAPQGVAVDTAGDVLVADTGNARIVFIAPNAVQHVLPVTGLVSPVFLTFDTASNLYISDPGGTQVIELPLGLPQVTVALSGAVVSPVAVVLDPASNLYVADGTAEKVVQLLVGGSGAQTLPIIASSLMGLALDSQNNIYVADSSASSVTEISQTSSQLNFSHVNVGNTSVAQELVLDNLGNQPLIFSQTGIASGSTANFVITGASSNACAQTTALQLGTTCGLSATFVPLVGGALSATLSFPGNEANVSNVSAVLSGIATLLAKTTSTLLLVSPPPIVAGNALSLTYTVQPLTGSGSPTGSISVTIDGGTAQTFSIVSGASTFTVNLNAGLHTIVAIYSGDAVYASSSATLQITAAAVPTVTALTYTSSLGASTPSITLTAAVSSTSASGITGSVSFYSGTTLIATEALGSNGTAKYVFPVSTATIYNLTATYNGAGIFGASTSSTLTPTDDFSLTADTATLAAVQGTPVYDTLTVTPYFDYVGALTPSCSGLPEYTVCNFYPTTVSFSSGGGASVTTQLSITTDIPSGSVASLGSHSGLVAFSLASLLPFLIAPCRRAFVDKQWLRKIVFLLPLILLLQLNGCGSTTYGKVATPVGTSQVTVTLTGANNVQHGITYSFTVVGNNTVF